MSIQAMYTIGTAPNTTTVKSTKESGTSSASGTSASSKSFGETAAVYEKTQTPADSVTVKNNVLDREAIITQMKADTEARMNQLTDIVRQTMSQQGKTFGLTDNIWKFLASGDFEVSADIKAQAQADIAEDGYWGVEQTSERILDFAKALSGGDASKADELFEAFKKGFQEATNTWGKSLPEISQKTYQAVEEKFAAWKAESAQTDTTTTTNTTVDPISGTILS